MDTTYWQGIREVENTLLHFLRTFEALQEEIDPVRLPESQTQLRQTVGERFVTLAAELAALSPPATEQEFHAQFTQAVR
ncbi:MAG: hypothetical protein NZ578_01895, partial [Candidatus Binatia bacterium]|nr:hypothetical protein [Candidatus Binatia bacterium]